MDGRQRRAVARRCEEEKMCKNVFQQNTERPIKIS